MAPADGASAAGETGAGDPRPPLRTSMVDGDARASTSAPVVPAPTIAAATAAPSKTRDKSMIHEWLEKMEPEELDDASGVGGSMSEAGLAPGGLMREASDAGGARSSRPESAPRGRRGESQPTLVW
jgi:hypothetical protein